MKKTAGIITKLAADRFVEQPDSPEKAWYNRNLFNPSKVDREQVSAAAVSQFLGDSGPMHKVVNNLPYTPFRSLATQESIGNRDPSLGDVAGHYLSNPLDAIKDYGKALGRGHTGTLIGTGVGLGAAGLLAYYLMKKNKQKKTAAEQNTTVPIASTIGDAISEFFIMAKDHQKNVQPYVNRAYLNLVDVLPDAGKRILGEPTGTELYDLTNRAHRAVNGPLARRLSSTYLPGRSRSFGLAENIMLDLPAAIQQQVDDQRTNYPNHKVGDKFRTDLDHAKRLSGLIQEHKAYADRYYRSRPKEILDFKSP